jgi:hypothetical protein
MKPTNKKKLSLSTEIVRSLSADELLGVAGGVDIGNITHSCFCISAVCSIKGDCNITTPPAPRK